MSDWLRGACVGVLAAAVAGGATAADTVAILGESAEGIPVGEVVGASSLDSGWLASAGCCGDGGCGAGHCRLAEDWWLFDVVFLQRDNQATDQILAAIGADAILTTGGPQYTIQPGIRLFRGHVDDCGRGWELGYLGIWNMVADRSAQGVDDINAADPLALLVDGFNDRSRAKVQYVSTLNTAEANVLLRSCHGASRCSPYPWERCGTYRQGTLDWLAGFRWAGLEERAGLRLSGGDYPGPSTYDVRSTSNFFGLQVGGRGRMEWDRWTFDGWAKTALAGVAMSQSAGAISSAFVPDPPIRPARAASEGGVGFIGDISLNAAYRLSDAWKLRAGYNFLWLSGVALAANQFDFGGTADSGSGLNGGAGVFFHGASLGLEAGW